MEIVYTVPPAPGYETQQLDQMSGCLSKCKHMLEEGQKQDTVWKRLHIIFEAVWFF